MNAYTYCLGDPVGRSDPSGHYNFNVLKNAATALFAISGVTSSALIATGTTLTQDNEEIAGLLIGIGVAGLIASVGVMGVASVKLRNSQRLESANRSAGQIQMRQLDTGPRTLTSTMVPQTIPGSIPQVRARPTPVIDYRRPGTPSHRIVMTSERSTFPSTKYVNRRYPGVDPTNRLNYRRTASVLPMDPDFRADPSKLRLPAEVIKRLDRLFAASKASIRR